MLVTLKIQRRYGKSVTDNDDLRRGRTTKSVSGRPSFSGPCLKVNVN